jgi:hypothetical protein
MKKLLLILLALYLFLMPNAVQACDETLVMLLTAKNPNSEFSKSIRKVATYLNNLGAALKAGLKKDYSTDLQFVMDAWLEFTTRYMTNPPEEARNDKHWAEKTRQTSETIGKIRKLILAGERMQAHDKVLELSSSIGKFFEAIGTTPEKKLFLQSSTNLTLLQQKVLAADKTMAISYLASVTADLVEYKKIIPEVAASSAAELEAKLDQLKEKMVLETHLEFLDPDVSDIRTRFDELRSHILMKEWFPETIESQKEKDK